MPRATQCTEYRGVKKTQSLYRIDHTLLILFTRLYGALYVVSHVRGSGYVPRPPTAAQRPAPTHDAARRRQGVARHCESVLGLRGHLQPPPYSHLKYPVYRTRYGVRLFMKHMATYTCVCSVLDRIYHSTSTVHARPIDPGMCDARKAVRWTVLKSYLACALRSCALWVGQYPPEIKSILGRIGLALGRSMLSEQVWCHLHIRRLGELCNSSTTTTAARKTYCGARSRWTSGKIK